MNIDIYNGFLDLWKRGIEFSYPDADNALTSVSTAGPETDSLRTEIFLQGAHLTQWRLDTGDSVIFLSELAKFEPAFPIRGGIPIIFPWFGPHPSDADAKAHGFARNKDWRLDSFAKQGDTETYMFSLSEDGSANPHWPYPYVLWYFITITPDTLFLRLTMEQNHDEPVPFEAALHTYFVVEDIHHVSIQGLEGSKYLDQLTGETAVQDGEVRFAAETDRIYFDTAQDLVIRDEAGGREILISTDAPSAVVWNPWIEKAQRLKDFGDDEWTKMVCLESGFIGKDKFTLEPGEPVSMSVAYKVRPLQTP